MSNEKFERPLNDCQIAAIVNVLRDIAIEFHGAQQLRERISHFIVPLLKPQAASAPADGDAFSGPGAKAFKDTIMAADLSEKAKAKLLADFLALKSIPATAPPDLSKLERFSYSKFSGVIMKSANGKYTRFADVEALLREAEK